ncbi:MAG TPA: hypothetical protein VHR45_19160 [Thermoanaerobaculia bacterium]|nr:hypothetical protein [Thermoanaerobaculia bacterium]
MSEPETPNRWPLSRCRETLWEAACQVLLLREELASLKVHLPLPDDLDERLEHRRPYDPATEILVTVEHVVQTFLTPTQAALEKSAAATEESLALLFHAEEAKWRR